MNAAVATLSSGLDSTIAAFLARESGIEIPLGITFDYGQRAAKREIAFATRIAERLDCRHKVISLPWFSEFTRGGALLRDETLPQPSPSDLDDRERSANSARSVWVPNRNGVMCEIAAGFAEDLGAEVVVVGFNREEASTFPDNSSDYLEQLTTALSFSTRTKVRLLSPTLSMDKRQIVAEARRLGIPLDLFWSCYEGGEKPCGTCESCQRFERAL